MNKRIKKVVLVIKDMFCFKINWKNNWIYVEIGFSFVVDKCILYYYFLEVEERMVGWF